MIIQGLNSTQNFGEAFVTLSKKNLGEHIANNIVTPFNNNLLKTMAQPTDSFVYDKYKEDTDFWALAAGSGSRFKPLANVYTEKTGIPANKISLPIKMDDGKDIHMLDWAMATAAPFAKDNKIKFIVAEKPSGSFGDIVAYNKKIMEMGADIKDTIVCCGDNVFDVSPRELDKFMLDTIRNPKKVMGLIGSEKTPQQVKDTFGVLSVAKDRTSIKDDVVSLMGFVEKPPLKEAEKLTLPNGNCVANTGMFVIKKEAMKALMDEIKVNPNVIKKNDNGPYDFANACKWVQAKYGADACDVKLVKNWEDVGAAPALFTFYNQIKNGHYLSELGKYGKMVKDSISKRFNYDENTKHGEMILTDKYNSLDEVPASVRANTEEFIPRDENTKEPLAWMKIY